MTIEKTMHDDNHAGSDGEPHGSRLAAAWQGARRLLLSSDDREATQRNAVLAFGVRVASAGILYISQVAMARWMGPHEYGIYVAVWTWVLVLSGLSHLGFAMAMIRLVPHYRETGQINLLRGALFASRFVAFAVATLLASLAVLVLAQGGPLATRPDVLALVIALACVPMCAISDVQDGICRGNAWMGTGLLPPYILRPTLVLLMMFAAHVAGFETNATTAACAAVVATWSATLIQTVLLHGKLAANLPQDTPSAYDWRTWIATALPLLCIGFSEIVLQNADVLVIQRTLSPMDAAIYFAAAKTMSLVMFVHYAVGSASANRFAVLAARGDKAKLRAAVGDAVGWTFWPTLAAVALILAAGQPLLTLFGPQFTSAYPMMFVLAAGFLLRASFGPAEFLLNMLGEQKRCALVMALGALFNVIANLVLVPLFGLPGAALATALALSFIALANAHLARKHLGIETWVGARR